MPRPYIAYSSEIVVGLVGAVGTDLDSVGEDLRTELRDVGYQVFPIRLSKELAEVNRAVSDLPTGLSYYDRLIALMNAGDEWRRDRGNDAMVGLAVAKIQELRAAAREKMGLPEFPPPAAGDGSDAEATPADTHEVPRSDGERADRFAYVLHQLKHPDEVDALRRIYGPAFILVAVYAPRGQRRDALAAKIAESEHDYRRDDFRAKAEALIERDLKDREKPYGQDVRDTFFQADVVVDGRDATVRAAQIKRFVQLLFGQSLHTPTRPEHAMFHAHAAALRSASLGRQVGAAVTNEDGDIVGVGTNEVPKAGGGLYWTGDPGDRRDHMLGYDPSDRMKRDVFIDILKKLIEEGWLTSERTTTPLDELVADGLNPNDGFLRDAHFMNLIEFMRPVHAEMAALSDCGRRGVPLQGTTLYVTAFPCHGCAKHIVAAGVERVVYVEPYPKSLTTDLYPDSVRVEDSGEAAPDGRRVDFEPFVGVAPRRYIDWFTKGKRKAGDGKVIKWEETRMTAPARLGDWVSTLNTTVVAEFEAFTRIM